MIRSRVIWYDDIDSKRRESVVIVRNIPDGWEVMCRYFGENNIENVTFEFGEDFDYDLYLLEEKDYDESGTCDKNS